MGDAAGELADDLHLRRLRDLPLEFRFFAIVLEQQQDCGIAKPAQPGNGQRHRLGAWWVSRTARSPDMAGPLALRLTASATAALSSFITRSPG